MALNGSGGERALVPSSWTEEIMVMACQWPRRHSSPGVARAGLARAVEPCYSWWLSPR